MFRRKNAIKAKSLEKCDYNHLLLDDSIFLIRVRLAEI
jgi:hypothetical protein